MTVQTISHVAEQQSIQKQNLSIEAGIFIGAQKISDTETLEMLCSSHQYGPFEIPTKTAFATLLLISESIAGQSVPQCLRMGVLSLWWWVKGQEAEGQDGIWSVTQVLPEDRGGMLSEKREALPWGKWAALPPYPVDPNFPLSVTSLMKIHMQTSPNCFPLHSSRRASSWQPEFLAKIGLPLPLQPC